MRTNTHRPGRAGVLAAAALLALGAALHASQPTHAQEGGAGGGEITFVRLANGEPGDEGIYIINADGSGERPLFLFEELGLPYDLNNGGYRCPVWSADGTLLALNGTESETNYLAVVDVESGEARRVYEAAHDEQAFHNIYFPEWVPGENALSFGFTDAERDTGVVLASGLRRISLDTGEVVTLRDDVVLTEGGAPRQLGGPVPNYTPFAHGWSPDGSQVALATYNWRTFLMDADGGNLRELAPQWANGDAAWSPDGTTLASSLYRLILLDPDDMTERELVPLGETMNGSTVESLDWSPDGGEIAYSTMWIDVSGGVFTTAFSVSVVDVETGEIRELTRTPTFGTSEYPYNISCVDWRPAPEA
jgi:Tol biopolymer transport system component